MLTLLAGCFVAFLVWPLFGMFGIIGWAAFAMLVATALYIYISVAQHW